MKRTPGAWTVAPYAWDAQGKATAWTVNTDAVPELDAEGHLQNIVFDGIIKTEADAHLGAAAPELFDVLSLPIIVRALRYIEEDPAEGEGDFKPGDSKKAGRAITLIHAALARARGES